MHEVIEVIECQCLMFDFRYMRHADVYIYYITVSRHLIFLDVPVTIYGGVF